MLRGFTLVFLKELRAVFTSPLVYVLAALFSLMLGYIFYNLLMDFVRMSELPESFSAGTDAFSALMRPLVGWINIILALMIPLITMRSFAEERREFTLDILLISPLSEKALILAKILSCWVVILFFVGLTLLFPVVFSLAGLSENPMVLTSYLGLTLVTLLYVSQGVFASSLCNHPLLAAFLSLILILGSLMISWIAPAIQHPWVSEWFRHFSALTHFNAFTWGAIRSVDLIYFITAIFFFSFLTKLSLESRRW